MPKRLEIPAGQRFGKLVVRHRVGKSHILMECDCGIVRTMWLCNVIHGKSTSCGRGLCHGHTIHGHTIGGRPTAEFRIWTGIQHRCHGPSADPRYVARGITVCDRWRSSFSAFLEDMGPRPSPTHSLDRVENGGNYEPGNCRWATKKEQMRNIRSNRIVEYRGKRMAFAQACEEAGVSTRAVYSRMIRWGVLFEEAVSRKPIVPRKAAA